MGNTLRVLAERSLPDRVPASGFMLVDLGENVHIHHRDMRQEFTRAEFFEYVDLLNQYADRLRTYLERNADYVEGAYPTTLLKCGPDPLMASPAPHRSAYFPDRLRIELEHPHDMGEIHIHWRDFRRHVTLDEFRAAADSFREASTVLEAVLSAHAYRPAARVPFERARRGHEQRRKPVPGAGHFARKVAP